jgi:hypothetical protein
MKSETIAIQQVFQDRRQYRVPFYQRAYVWTKEEQWEPLWNDVVEKAEARENGENPPPHFLGAIVLEPQPRTGLRGVETYHIIDGQQRLTTLQYFLVALAMAARDGGHSSLLPHVEACLWNPNPETMANPEIERFKVWPTFRDREPFRAAMSAEGRDGLREEFPANFTQSDSLRRVGIEHPLALAAIWYFHDRIDEWLGEMEGDERGLKLEQLASALLRDLRLVSISLDENDDAQVIFETLNGRGAELHATDLIRNFIFMRADREAADSAALYDTLWSPFESGFWTEEQRRGRLRKPRLEWFMQSALQAELGDTIDVGKLYAEYRKFGMRQGMLAEKQLNLLTRYAEVYQQFSSGAGDSPIARFGKRLAPWDVSPTHALALRVAVSGLPDAAQTTIFDTIMSYLTRRAFCGLTTKNYNNVFFQLLKRFQGETASAEGFASSLAALDGAGSRWPTDDEFRRAWMTESAHDRIGDISRIRGILAEVENGMRSPRAEEHFVPTPGMLDIDHILPDKWYEHWDLNGEMVTAHEASQASLATLFGNDDTPRQTLIARRERLKATMGNLTLAHYGINRSAQNSAFEIKRQLFFAESNLHLNRSLMVAPVWNEDAIEKRGRDLFEIARTIWKGPSQPPA